MKHIKVHTIEDAWREADKIIRGDYMKDDYISERCGYPVYYSTLEGCFDRINDLNTRIEVVTVNGYIEDVTTIWISDIYDEVRKQLASKTKELYA